jgi:Glucokinase
MLDTVAGDLALTIGATGGIYIAGGILLRFKEAFASSAFRERFEYSVGPLFVFPVDFPGTGSELPSVSIRKADRWRKHLKRGSLSRRIRRISRNPAPAKTS